LAEVIGKYLPKIDLIFSSEPYWDYIAGFLNIEHISFDYFKQKVPITTGEIHENPKTIICKKIGLKENKSNHQY